MNCGLQTSPKMPVTGVTNAQRGDAMGGVDAVLEAGVCCGGGGGLQHT